MASLKNDVLLKLLEDMKVEENASEDDRKPVLLQIRSIIPVLEGGDLWPDRGFFLKVSDLSHALYVSLPQEQNEMILGNKLKLGQFIYVQRLENAHPVPLLRGVTPVPGRRLCEGTPEDIVSQESFVKILEASGVDSIVEKGVISEKKITKNSSSSRKLVDGLSDSESLRKRNEGFEGRCRGRFRSLSPSRTRPGNVKTDKCTMKMPDYGYNIGGERPKSRSSSIDNDSDADSILSCMSSAHISKRRSWNESEILGVKEIFDSSVVKQEFRSPARSRSANNENHECENQSSNGYKKQLLSCLQILQVSPVRSLRYDSSDDNCSSASRRRSGIGSAKRLIKSTNKGQTPVTKVNNVQMPNSLCSLVYDRKGAETRIFWNSLPSNLVKIGKEVIKQRDMAVVAAADALQEACTAERLLSSLSKFSEFPLAEGDDLQPYVDKCFDLQDDLARTRLIMQSLTSISPFRTPESESCTTTNSVKETLSIAVERKKNAATWIKSAVALDLSPCSPELSPMTNPSAVTNNVKKASASSHSTKSKGSTCIIKKKKSNANIHLVFASEKDDQNEWTKGSTLCAATGLAISLQDECRKLLLSYMEKYLDEIERKCSSMESENHMAGIMYKVKMVSDWLDLIVNKEGNGNLPKDIGGRLSSDHNLEDSDIEIYGRLRNKIYGILMKQVERTALAFECNKN